MIFGIAGLKQKPLTSIHVWGLAASSGDDSDWQRITQQIAIYGSPGGTDNRTVSRDATFFGAAVVTSVTLTCNLVELVLS